MVPYTDLVIQISELDSQHSKCSQLPYDMLLVVNKTELQTCILETNIEEEIKALVSVSKIQVNIQSSKQGNSYC